MDIRKIYEYALQREIEGKRFFEENAERLQHAAAKGAFKVLAQEEQKHIFFIEKQLASLNEGQGVVVMEESLQPGSFFAQRAESEQVDQSVAQAMVADLPVLRMAYLIERDFAEFYEMAASKAEGSAKQVLQSLAEWERTHEALFKNMHDTIFEQYAQMPWGG
jgi:rubrerythrin